VEITDGIATFPNGLKLRIDVSQISHIAVADATQRYPDPPVPRSWIESRGEFEENPNSPDYALGIERAKERRSWAAVKAMVVLGSELAEAPANMPGPDDVDWDRLAAVRDIPSPTGAWDRYEMWLRYYAFLRGYPTPQAGLAEYLELVRHLATESALTMEAASAIVATFRPEAGRPADPDGGAVAAAGDGDVGGHVAADRAGY
jgi:hypothetical protein